jgi:hypothetical protein
MLIGTAPAGIRIADQRSARATRRWMITLAYGVAT